MTGAAGTAYDDWQATPTGRYLNGRIKSLILDLTLPRAGERLLDIGCGSGDHLDLFRKKGCDVTGLDSSPFLLALASQRLAQHADLHPGKAEDLPFSDNEFDIVTLIATLEFTEDPGLAVAEAIRVCRGRVFIGAMNRYSPIGLQGRLTRLLDASSDKKPRFFHLTRLHAMIRSQLQGVRVQWGSVIFLPWGWYGSGAGMEERLPVMYNPFGAFFGLSFHVTFSYRTIQQTIGDPVSLNTNGRRPVPGVVSGWKHGS
ncbi:MAG: methyltransferase domain-containing protein [Thermodesulfobacteriota bacterium]